MKQKLMKRISLLLCACMVFTMMPIGVFAADAAPKIDTDIVGDTGNIGKSTSVCTQSEDCTAENHEKGCPKCETLVDDASISCMELEDCAEGVHDKNCPLYVDPKNSDDSIGIATVEETLQGNNLAETALDFTIEGAATSGDGWLWDSSTSVLTLSGAIINGNIKLPTDSTIILANGSTNSITTTTTMAAIHGEGNLTIKSQTDGSATLTVDNKSDAGSGGDSRGNAIEVSKANGNISLTIQNCQVTADGKNAILATTSVGDVAVNITNATVTASKTEGQSAGPRYAVNTYAPAGSAVLSISNSDVTATEATMYGMQCNASAGAEINIASSKIEVATVAGSDAILATGKSSSKIIISESTLNGKANSNGIFSKSDDGTAIIEITGGLVTIAGGDYGIYAKGASDASVSLADDSSINSIGSRQTGLEAESTDGTAALNIDAASSATVGNGAQDNRVTTTANAVNFSAKSSAIFVKGNDLFAITAGNDVSDVSVSKAGSTFSGWYDNDDFNGDAVTIPVTGTTYYAKWLTLSGTCGAEDNEKNVTWALTEDTRTIYKHAITAYPMPNLMNEETLTLDIYNIMTHDEFIEYYKITDASCVTTTVDPDTHYTLTISGTGDMADMEKTTQPWMDARESITNLVIDDGVTALGKWAFGQCNKLSGVLSLPDSLTTIGGECFNSCLSLTGVDLNQVKTLSWSAFYGCKALTGDLIIPEGITAIGGWAFDHCYFLNGTLTLPDSLLTIGQQSFCYTGFTATKIPENLTSIGVSAFVKCTELTGTLRIPNSVTILGDSTYSRAGYISVVFGSGITSMGKNIFTNCESLAAVDMTRVDFEHLTIGATNFTQLASNIILYVSDNTDLTKLADQYTTTKTSLAVTCGGTFADDTVFEAGMLATPTKDNYIFDGWYDNDDFIGDAVTTAEAGKTYYAKWNKLPAITLGDQVGENAFVYDSTGKMLVATLENTPDAEFTYTYARRTNADAKETFGEATSKAPINAGYYKVVASLSGTKRTATAYLEIKPAPLTVLAIKEASKSFDGTDTFENVSLTLSGVQGSDQVTATATAKVSGVEIGTYPSAHLTNIKLAGARGNYSITTPADAVNVENGMNLTITKPKVESSATTDTNLKNSSGDTPQTGDKSMTWLWWTLAVVSLLLGGTVLVIRKKRTK